MLKWGEINIICKIKKKDERKKNNCVNPPVCMKTGTKFLKSFRV